MQFFRACTCEGPGEVDRLQWLSLSLYPWSKIQKKQSSCEDHEKLRLKVPGWAMNRALPTTLVRGVSNRYEALFVPSWSGCDTWELRVESEFS